MDSTLPDFEQPPASIEPAPKKPRRKPTKRKRPVKKAAVRVAAPKRPRKVRPARKRVVTPMNTKNTNHGGRFTVEAYRLIGLLLEQDVPNRNLIMAIVKGMS